MFNINNKKAIQEFTYFIIRVTGFTFLIRNLLRRSKVTILIFHNIEYQTAYRLFHFIKNKYNPAPLRAYVDYLDGRLETLPPKALVVTLDDGYKEDFFLLELLKVTGIVRTIFLGSDFINTNNNYWFRSVGDHKQVNNMKRISNQDRI